MDKVDSVDGVDRPHERTLRISMFAMFDLVVDKVDSVDEVDGPHENPLRF